MPPTERTVYFLGAGATRADHPDAPLGDDLLHWILASNSVSPVLRNFLTESFADEAIADTATALQRPRLDDVFTLLDAYISGRAPAPGPMSTAHAGRIRGLLTNAIALTLNSALQAGPGKQSARFGAFLYKTSVVVISTNYDLVMDNGLSAGGTVDYGVSVRGRLTLAEDPPYRRTTAYVGQHLFLRPARTVDPHPTLLKLHGSLNWLYCPRCDELDVTIPGKGAAVIIDDPTRARCTTSTCTADYQTIIVGPSLVQSYEPRVIRETWDLAEVALHEADRLVIVGYSLPEADYLIRAMLVRHFARRSERVLVVSKGDGDSAPNADTLRRYRRLFPRCEFEWRGFEYFISSLA